ncbi:MAG: NUDIX domain-containing protein [Magnetococcales bacterium]|nr:NUDIX domain-containing protein [Magnetococcales bacterium]
MNVELIKSRIVHDGFFRLFSLLLRFERFDGSMSRPVTLESLERGEVVVVLLYDPKTDRVGLIRQFRIGPHLAEGQGYILEMVAGACNQETDHEQVARREVSEETGWALENLTLVRSFYLNPAGSTERIYLFLGLFDGLSNPKATGLDHEDEDILPITLTFDEAWDKMGQGEINSAIPILALQWLKDYRQSILKGQSSTRLA